MVRNRSKGGGREVGELETVASHAVHERDTCFGSVPGLECAMRALQNREMPTSECLAKDGRRMVLWELDQSHGVCLLCSVHWLADAKASVIDR